MPEFCKDGRFEKLILNPALSRREKEQRIKEILEGKKGLDEHKFDYLLCMPERFQRYMIDKELRREFYQNKSVPFAKTQTNRAKMGKVNNIRKKGGKDARGKLSGKKRKRKKKATVEMNKTKPLEVWKPKADSKSSSVPKIGSNQLAFLKNQRDKFKRKKKEKALRERKTAQGNDVWVLDGKVGNTLEKKPVCYDLFFD